MASSFLFYGPGAEKSALEKASELGQLIAPPFGSEGLKVDEARQVVNLLCSPPLADKIGIVLIGPMDRANDKSADVLLKNIEEFDSNAVWPILWANDLGSIRPTILSRCITRWCPLPGVFEEEPEPELLESVQQILKAIEENEIVDVVSAVKEHKSNIPGLITALAFVLCQTEKVHIWNAIRPLTQFTDPTQNELLVALIRCI